MGGDEKALRIRVIGGVAVDGLAEPELGSRKARTALRLLAIAATRPVSTERVAEVLWGDTQPRDPAAQVAVIMSRLRRVLGSRRITRNDAGYSLALDWLDLTAAAELVAEAERRLAAGAPAAALAAATAARGLLGHPVLDDDVWADEERRNVERLAARSLHLVARAALAAADLGTGIEAAQQALDADPFDEEALRLAMAGFAVQGRDAAALALHELLRTRLSHELGVSPSAETEAAHRAVLKGLPVPGVIVGSAHAARPLAAGGEQLVEREDELRALDAVFASVGSGRPAVAVIDGEPGIGKTALASVWVDALAAGTVVLSTRCEQLSRALPLQPVLQLLRNHFRTAGADDTERLLGADAALLEPLLDRPSAGTRGSAEPGQLPPTSGAGIALVVAALRRVVTRVAAAPTVLFVDDIQRADTLTMHWIAELARDDGLPLLVLLTRRRGEGDVPDGALTITLAPLSIGGARRLVGEERADELYLRSAGNPLFLTELARTGPDDPLPPTVQAAVVARCAEAGDAAETLRAAAVLGARIDVDLLAHVRRADPVDVIADLERGLALAILDERDGSYAFRHEVSREALAAALGSPRRAFLHREAAIHLAQRADADPMLVAHHARLSGARTIAAAALVAASRVASDRFDYPTALELAGEALAAQDGTAVRLQRAAVLLSQARYREAQVDAEVAVSNGDDLRAWEVAGSIAYYCQAFDRAAGLGAALAEVAATPQQRAQGLVIRARADHARGEVAAAAELLREAETVCRQHRLPRPTSVHAFLLVHMGDPGGAVAAIAASPYASAASLSTIYTPVHVHFIHGYALATLGRAGEALRVLETAGAEAGRRGLARYASLGVNMSAWIHRNTGDLDRARRCNEEARVGAADAGYRELEVYAALDPCDDDIQAGDIDAAEMRLEQARRLMEEPYAYDWRHRLRVELLNGRVALALDDAAAALHHATRLIDDARLHCAPRHVGLGEQLRLRARAALVEEPPSADVVAALCDALPRVAGVEGWWLLAELGAALGDACSTRAAQQQRDRLAASLDTAARPAFADYAGARLERIRTRGRSG